MLGNSFGGDKSYYGMGYLGRDWCSGMCTWICGRYFVRT